MNRLFESARSAARFYGREVWACGARVARSQAAEVAQRPSGGRAGLGQHQLSSLKAVATAGCRSVGMARRLVVTAMLGLSLAAAGSAIAQQAKPAASPATAQAAAPGSAAAPPSAPAPATPAPSTAAPGAAAAPAGDAASTPDAAAPDTRGLDQEVQGLKKDVVDLNR